MKKIFEGSKSGGKEDKHHRPSRKHNGDNGGKRMNDRRKALSRSPRPSPDTLRRHRNKSSVVSKPSKHFTGAIKNKNHVKERPKKDMERRAAYAALLKHHRPPTAPPSQSQPGNVHRHRTKRHAESGEVKGGGDRHIGGNGKAKSQVVEKDKHPMPDDNAKKVKKRQPFADISLKPKSKSERMPAATAAKKDAEEALRRERHERKKMAPKSAVTVSKTPLTTTPIPSRHSSTTSIAFNLNEVLRIGGVLGRYGMDKKRRDAFDWLASHPNEAINGTPQAVYNVRVAMGDLPLSKTLVSQVLHLLLERGEIMRSEYDRHFSVLEQDVVDQSITISQFAYFMNVNCKKYKNRPIINYENLNQ